MALTVTCYQYNGMPNVCNKTPDLISYGEIQAHMITDRKTLLSCVLELNEMVYSVSLRINTNYVSFVDWGARRTYWFVDNISRNGSTYYYHLSLDVLMTNWNDIQDYELLLERSSSETGGMQIYGDNLWKVGTERNITIVEASNGLVTEPNTTDNSVILSTVSKTDTIVGNYGVTGTVANTYSLTQPNMSNVVNAFYDTNFLNSLTTYFSNPTSAVVSCRAYPFKIIPNANSAVTSIKFAHLYLTFSQDIANQLTSELYDLDFGYVDFPYGLDDFRDYEPYSTYYLYLPFYGMVEVDKKIFEDRIYINYKINLLTGNTQIRLKRRLNEDALVIIPCEIGVDLPLSSGNLGGAYLATLNLGLNAVNSLTTPHTVKTTISNDYDYNRTKKKRISGRLRTTATDVVTSHEKTERAVDYGHSMPIPNFSFINGSTNVMSLSSTIPQSAFSESDNKVSLISIKPTAYNDDAMLYSVGRLVVKYVTLSELTEGYQKFSNVHMPMGKMTADEYEELVDILENGVWIKNPTFIPISSIIEQKGKT